MKFSVPLLPLAFVFPVVLSGQVLLDRPVMLTGTTQEDRQVTGLPLSTMPGSVLAAGVEQAGQYRTTTPTGSDTWIIDLPSLSTAPIAGTHLMVLTPAGTDGPVSLLVNGHGPYPLVSGIGEPFDLQGIASGTPLSVILDGSNFHVLNGSTYVRKPCPPNTVAVNEQFCIEPSEHAESDFFTAISGCAASGLRLCSWAEFIVACNKGAELGLVGMTNNWEWIDDAVNENGTARMVGANGCGVASAAIVSGSFGRASRCCATR